MALLLAAVVLPLLVIVLWSLNALLRCIDDDGLRTTELSSKVSYTVKRTQG